MQKKTRQITARLFFHQVFFDLHGLELILADSAERACPVVGERVEFDTVIIGGIVDVTADFAYVFHFYQPFISISLRQA
jgi:hypothetical protein